MKIIQKYLCSRFTPFFLIGLSAFLFFYHIGSSNYFRTGIYGITDLIIYISLIIAVIIEIICLFTPKAQHPNKYFRIFRLFLIIVICSLFFIYYYTIYNVHRVRYENSLTDESKINLVLIGKEILKFAEKTGHFPDSEKWCDLLVSSNPELSKDIFRNHGESTNSVCHFAFNKHLSGLKCEDISSDTVLLFEAKGHWNISGDITLIKKLHRHFILGVVFVDGVWGRYHRTYSENLAECRKEDEENECYMRNMKWDPNR